jgi:MoaA/NifB/PqqE/SkfB family radical SAM enzyme
MREPDDAGAFAYDVECDWHLLSTCNYRCRYCFFPPEQLGSKLKVHASPREWRDAFAATGRRWLIHFTGGEPTIYPEFVTLCALLARDHLLSINTNLSHKSVRALAGEVDAARISFINASLHAAERTRHRGFAQFFANARFLQNAGFRVVVTVVATPAVVAAFADLRAACAAHGLVLAPKVLRGSHQGRNYPSFYTAAERALLRAEVARARDAYTARFPDWPRPSIDVFSDDELLMGRPGFRGVPCAAGLRFVSLASDGEVRRCNTGRPSLGNLLRRSVRFAAAPLPCDTSYCVYFCKKYTAEAARITSFRPVVPA